MKQGWEIKRLEDCFKLKSGAGLTSKNMSVGGTYPVFGGNGIAGLHNNFNLSGSNIIIGRVGALCGNVRHMNEKIWLTDNAFKIVDFKFDFDHSFLTYLLNFKNLREYARQAAQPVISNSSLKDVVLNFPKSIHEQQHIVSILDEAFSAITKAKANAQQNLKNAKELFDSYLQGVFENKGKMSELGLVGLKDELDLKSNQQKILKSSNLKNPNSDSGNWKWETKTLNEISENLDSKRVPITKNVRNEGSIPYYGASGVVDYVADYLFNEDLLCVSEDGANLLARTYPIAFSIKGKTWVNNHAHVLRFKNMDSQKFVELYLNYIKLDDFVSGMAQPKLNQTMLNKIPIPFPPLKEQQIIVQKLDALSAETKKLEAIYKQKINDLEELKKSVLQKAFSGELKTEKLETV